MFRSSMRSSSGSSLFIPLSMLFKKDYQVIVVMWQHMFSTHYMYTKHMLPHNHDEMIILFKYFNSF